MSKFFAIVLPFVPKAFNVALAPVVLVINSILGPKGQIPRKLTYVVIAGILSVLQAKHPEWSLPSADFIVDALWALIAGHTLTDIAATVAVIIQQWIASRTVKANGNAK